MLKRKNRTTILLTGASGFVGKYVINALKNKYDLIAMSRRSGTEAGIPFHPNIRWVQWNIANKLNYSEVMGYLIGRGGADIVIHLAGYYDYEYNNNPEYEKTNVNGTKNVLELARNIDVKHFIFASSLAACNFPADGQVVNDKSKVDANFAYAISKQKGEEMCREYSNYFKCSVVRFAAVFSDWCEYGPLYQFLSTWLSQKWDSKILGGNGESAITYIHITDLIKLLKKIIEKEKDLPQLNTYIASPDGYTTHKELYEVATRDFYGQKVKPMFINKYLTYPGVFIKSLLGKLNLVSKPFEKYWMLQYIDKKLDVDASNTREILSWETIPRFHILRRLVFLLDKMKSHPSEWNSLNEAATKRDTFRPNLLIYEQLISSQELIETTIVREIESNSNNEQFVSFQKLASRTLKTDISTLFHLVLASVRSADRTLILKYLDDFVTQKFIAGFTPDEINNVLDLVDKTISNSLSENEELENLKQDIYDYVGLSIQLAKDEVEDIFDTFEQRLPEMELMEVAKRKDKKVLQEEIKQLSAFYQEYQE